MNKSELLIQIHSLASAGKISRDELLNAFDEGAGKADNNTQSTTLSRYSSILYYIGGGIIAMGLVFFIGQLWSEFNTFMRIFITLGVGISTYIMGVLFNQEHRLGSAGPAFFMISALLIPTGILISFDEFNFRLGEERIQNIISGLLFATYLVSYLVFKRFVLLAFSFLFGTWFYFALAGSILNDANLLPDWRFGHYLFTALGLSYLFIGHAFQQTDKDTLVKILYFLGINFFLASALFLTGWQPAQDIFWEILYPGIIFIGFYVSAVIHSRIILSFSAVYLAAYIIKITVEYFSDGLGWPMTLILCGFLLMGMGYMTIYLKRKYDI